MLYAVTIDPIPAIFFLTEPPGEGPWDVEEGVDLDLPFNLAAWPEGTERPNQTLGRSIEDLKHYRMFKYGRDLAACGFAPTGRPFGGLYSRSSWERFAREILPNEPDLSELDVAIELANTRP